MEREDVYDTLVEVFQDVFEDPTIELQDDTTVDDIDDWETMENYDLIAAVEQEFGVKFSAKQVKGMRNVGDMVDVILSQIQ